MNLNLNLTENTDFLSPEYIAETAEIKAIIDEATAIYKARQANIQAEMEAKELTEVFVGYHSVKLTHYQTTTFDKKALKADHPEIYSQYEGKEPRARFTLK